MNNWAIKKGDWFHYAPTEPLGFDPYVAGATYRVAEVTWTGSVLVERVQNGVASRPIRCYQLSNCNAGGDVGQTPWRPIPPPDQAETPDQRVRVGDWFRYALPVGAVNISPWEPGTAYRVCRIDGDGKVFVELRDNKPFISLELSEYYAKAKVPERWTKYASDSPTSAENPCIETKLVQPADEAPLVRVGDWFRYVPEPGYRPPLAPWEPGEEYRVDRITRAEGVCLSLGGGRAFPCYALTKYLRCGEKSPRWVKAGSENDDQDVHALNNPCGEVVLPTSQETVPNPCAEVEVGSAGERSVRVGDFFRFVGSLRPKTAFRPWTVGSVYRVCRIAVDGSVFLRLEDGRESCSAGLSEYYVNGKYPFQWAKLETHPAPCGEVVLPGPVTRMPEVPIHVTRTVPISRRPVTCSRCGIDVGRAKQVPVRMSVPEGALARDWCPVCAEIVGRREGVRQTATKAFTRDLAMRRGTDMLDHFRAKGRNARAAALQVAADTYAESRYGWLISTKGR